MTLREGSYPSLAALPMMATARQHHYVQARYLDRFLASGSAQLGCYGRGRSKAHRSIPDGLASQRDFYAIPNPPPGSNLEYSRHYYALFPGLRWEERTCRVILGSIACEGLPDRFSGGYAGVPPSCGRALCVVGDFTSKWLCNHGIWGGLSGYRFRTALRPISLQDSARSHPCVVCWHPSAFVLTLLSLPILFSHPFH